MTEPETVDVALPDEARLLAEIGDDRRHERFLVRAAFVAALLVALAITTRMLWA